jgi:O-acetyl-ADP-ribose deacetylase (regulator of RNase III)
MRTVHGDLIDLVKAGEFQVIAHGCNCFCSMGRGIALAIRQNFPEAALADKLTVKGDKGKLGTCTFAAVEVGAHAFTVVNAYTQYHWDGDGVEVLVQYDAVRSCMEWIKANHTGKIIGLPKIGAGLARGDWLSISEIIEEVLAGEDVTIVNFSQ